MCLFTFKAKSQTDSLITDSLNGTYYRTDWAFITGYQLQKNHFLESGIAIIKDGSIGHHPSSIYYGLSNEIKIHDKFIWGLKSTISGAGGNGPYNMALNLAYYTDFENSTVTFRPEIGLGLSIFRIYYGYNFPIFNKNFRGINKHNFGVNILIKFKSIKELHYY